MTCKALEHTGEGQTFQSAPEQEFGGIDQNLVDFINDHLALCHRYDQFIILSTRIRIALVKSLRKKQRYL